MMNLGGPKSATEVGPFLQRVFTDEEIMDLPLQRYLGPRIAKRRTPKVEQLYEGIGGGSPIEKWMREQGSGMVQRLDRLSPGTAPHRFYTAFRYVEPFSDDALAQMRDDGVKRAVAFTQYPQYSCVTTGSSLNELWRASTRLGLQNAFDWSVIDRWPTHPTFVAAVAERVREGIASFEDPDDVLVLFSAHSLPIKTIRRGDPYPYEIATTVHEVMTSMGFSHEHLLSYQSQVGPLKWQGPSTEEVIRQLGAKGRNNVLIVGIAFTSDHIETLSEIDIEFAEVAHESGIRTFKRAPALNASPLFLDALAEIASEHLASGDPCSSRYGLRCPGCTNPACHDIHNPIAPYKRTGLRPGVGDAVAGVQRAAPAASAARERVPVGR
jgi:ferrochelatase